MSQSVPLIGGYCNSLRLAVMQVAVREAVYLLDMVTLPQVVAPKTLRHFMHNLFGSNHNLKLGTVVVA